MSDEDGRSRDNCRVLVRVRPARCPEDEPVRRVLEWDNGKTGEVTRPLVRLLFPEMDRSYHFDGILPPESSQKECYHEICRGMLEAFLEGYNCSLLAYGQTGSGKTFTMGTAQDGSRQRREERGIVPRALEDLFRAVEQKRSQNEGLTMELMATYIEIYNEEVRDLLNPEGSMTPTMKLGIVNSRQSAGGGVGAGIRIAQDAQTNQIILLGVKQVMIDTTNAAMECLTCGGLYRSTGSNKLNLVSSRSHAIFTITLSQQRRASEDNPKSSLISKFHFVDLAGSERVKRTQSQGSRMREGININGGLLALSNVISHLTDEARRVGGDSHIPYRDSKLTRLLQDSLGGNSRTTMIACISPLREDFAETFSTIKYATRARHIKNTPVVNKDPATMLVETLRARIQTLEEELQAIRDRPTTSSESLERELCDLREILTEREQRESAERARRIALEARVIRYRERYQSLLHEIKSSCVFSPSEKKVETAEDDDDEEESTAATLTRNSELELIIETLKREVDMISAHCEKQSNMLVELEKELLEKENKMSRMYAYLKQIAIGPVCPTDDEQTSLVGTSVGDSDGEPSSIEDSSIKRLMRSASYEEQSTLLCMMEALTGQTETSQTLKSKSDRLAVAIKTTDQLLTGMEREKLHWEQIVSDLGYQISALSARLANSEAQKRSLGLKIEALEEPSEGLGALTPINRPGESISSPNRIGEVSVVLHRKLEKEQEHVLNGKSRLSQLTRELDEVNRKRDENEQKILHIGRALDQLKSEKAAIAKKISEQEKRHRLVLAEKDKLIDKLEKRAKRTDDELVKQRVDNASKIASLQRKNEELHKKMQISRPRNQPAPPPVPLPTKSDGRKQASTNTKRFGGVVVAPELSAGAKVLLQKAARVRLAKYKRVEHLKKMERRVAAIKSEMEGVNKVMAVDGDALALADRLEALKTERDMYLAEIEHEAQNASELTSSATVSRIISEAKTAARANPEIYFEAFMELFTQTTYDLHATTREVKRLTQELQDLRVLHSNAHRREEALLSDFERQRIELMLSANNDKVTFMNSFRSSCVGHSDGRSQLRRSRSTDDGKSRSEAAALRMEVEVLKERLKILSKEKALCEPEPPEASEPSIRRRLHRTSISAALASCEPSVPPSSTEAPSVAHLNEADVPADRRHSASTETAQSLSLKDANDDKPIRLTSADQRGRIGAANHVCSNSSTCADDCLCKSHTSRASESFGKTSRPWGIENGHDTPLHRVTAATEGTQRSPARVQDSERQRSAASQNASPWQVAGSHSLGIGLVTDVREIHTDYVTTCAFGESSSLTKIPSKLLTGSLGEIKLWDINRLDSLNPKTAEILTWRDLGGLSSRALTPFINSICFLRENVIVTGAGASIKILDMRTGQESHSWLYAPPSDVEDHQIPTVQSLTPLGQGDSNSYGHYIAAAGSDLAVRVFDTRMLGLLPLCKLPSGDEGARLSSIPRMKSDAEVMDGLVSGGDRGVIRLWSQGWSFLPALSNLGQVQCLESAAVTLDGSPFWSLCCCSDRDDRPRLWLWEDSSSRPRGRPQVLVGRSVRDQSSEAWTSSSERDFGSEALSGVDNDSINTNSLTASTWLDGSSHCVSGDGRGRLRSWRTSRRKVEMAEDARDAPVEQFLGCLESSLVPPLQQFALAEIPLLNMDSPGALPRHRNRRKINKLLSLKIPTLSSAWMVFSTADDTNLKVWSLQGGDDTP